MLDSRPQAGAGPERVAKQVGRFQAERADQLSIPSASKDAAGAENSSASATESPAMARFE